MNEDNYENVTWDNLLAEADQKEHKKIIEQISNLLKINQVNFLLKQFSRFCNKDDIKVINQYQQKQHELGAWVKGLFPDQFVDEDIIAPDSYSSILKCILQLAEQRKENLEAIKERGEYNLDFNGEEFVLPRQNYNFPDNWKLEIDLDVFKNTLYYIIGKQPDKKQAVEIASLPGNQEMLKHRKNLGYLPEPITDEGDLSELLLWAASDRPEDIIWKWLNPLNIFELADVYNNHQEFKQLYSIIAANKENICDYILSKLSNYITFEIKFNETFSLTIGYAIRGWATDNRFGVNIENIKDDYERLIATIAHELFHRLQSRICYADGGIQTFSDLVSENFADERDNKFYEVLSYIMLEGTGEYITHQFSRVNEDKLCLKAREGTELLNEIYDIIYGKGNLEKAEQLLGQGLKSNGVFYSLGEYITECLIEDKGKNYLGNILKEGVRSFFREGFAVDSQLKVNSSLQDKINGL